MLRRAPCLALCVVLFGSASAWADEPLNVAAESARITAEFSKRYTSREEYNAAVEKRNAALADLVARAEKAKSQEHGPLARAYAMLERYDGAVREARAAIKENETDVESHSTLITSLASAGKFDEALAAWQVLEKHADTHVESPAFLGRANLAFSTLANQLANAERYDDAKKMIDGWKTRLGAVTPATPAGQATLDRLLQGINTLAGRIESAQKRAALVGKPYFHINDATWLNGSPMKPEDLRGKVVLLDFWAVWCGPCIAVFPHLKQWQEEYGDKGLVIIGVTRHYQYDWDAEAKRIKRVEGLEPEKENAATAAFLAHHELKHRIAVMPDNSLSQQYLVTGIPQAVLIDKQGHIKMIRVGSGDANAKAMEAAIREALELKPESVGGQ